jgi:hypothetical protein
MSSSKTSKKKITEKPLSATDSILLGLTHAHITKVPPADVRKQLTRAIELLFLEVPDLSGPDDHHMILTLTQLRQGFDKAHEIEMYWRVQI